MPKDSFEADSNSFKDVASRKAQGSFWRPYMSRTRWVE